MYFVLDVSHIRALIPKQSLHWGVPLAAFNQQNGLFIPTPMYVVAIFSTSSHLHRLVSGDWPGMQFLTNKSRFETLLATGLLGASLLPLYSHCLRSDPVYIYIYIYIYIYTHVCICMYIYIHTVKICIEINSPTLNPVTQPPDHQSPRTPGP